MSHRGQSGMDPKSDGSVPMDMISSSRVLVVLHGVNLGLLGERPVIHYGRVTLPELEAIVCDEARAHGWRCECHQTDHEGDFVQLVHANRHADAMLVNPGAWTHYSYAIRDALELVAGPVAEVHLSDIEERDEWRKVSVVADVASVRVAGRGPEGYREAVRALVDLVESVDIGTPREGS